MARRWSLRLVAGLLAGGVVLSGCSEKQEANDSLPTASASPTEDELPPLGPEDLPMPDEARTQDAAGAEAFVRYYIELINRTSDVMDAEPLREFSDGCADCERIATNTDEAAPLGHDYEGGDDHHHRRSGDRCSRRDCRDCLARDQAAFTVVRLRRARRRRGSQAVYRHLSGGVALAVACDRQATWTMTELTFG